MKFKGQGKHDKNDAASQHTDSQTEEDRAVLVISPLNALIQNQISRLQELGLSCIFVRRAPHSTSVSVRGSSSSKVQYLGDADDHDQSTSAQDIVYDHDYCHAEDLKLLKEETFKFIFPHPEVLCQKDGIKATFRSEGYQNRIVATVVDEAHLIQEW